MDILFNIYNTFAKYNNSKFFIKRFIYRRKINKLYNKFKNIDIYELSCMLLTFLKSLNNNNDVNTNNIYIHDHHFHITTKEYMVDFIAYYQTFNIIANINKREEILFTIGKKYKTINRIDAYWVLIREDLYSIYFNEIKYYAGMIEKEAKS